MYVQNINCRVLSFCLVIFNFILNILRLFLKKIYINFLKKFSINSFVDYDLYIRNPRNILFGKNLSINYGCSFFSSCQYYKNGGIIVMDNITFSPAVKIYSIAQNYKSPYFENIEEKVKINSNDKRCAG